ncbi:MAG: T9SS type A sorting domain-containing protein [bacterium]|nr:T9SS type A sorting domain-containing protein [bacterium]
MRRILGLITAVTLLTSLLSARTIYVPQNYPTIGAAITAAVSGDSILVGPGIYDPPPTVYNSPDHITLLGNGYMGPNRTTILGNFSTEIEGKIDIRYVDNWEIGGFELTAGHKGINTEGNKGVYIHDIYVHNVTWSYADGVMVNGNNIIIERSIFANCPYAGLEIWYPNQSGHIFRNNTILNCPNGVLVRGTTPNLIIENNIIINCGDGVEFATQFVGSEYLNYNDAWNNSSNWTNCQPGSNNISANPMFVGGIGAEQYKLQLNSPCIDTGNPGSPYDPDGTRADIGCFYFDQSPPGGILTLNVAPIAPPIVIPREGGPFNYTAEASCDMSGWVVFDAWAELVLPNGFVMGPLYVRPQIHLNAGETIFRELEFYVSAWAMPGIYEFRLNLGDSPDSVYVTDSFIFEKLENLDKGSYDQSSFVIFSGWDGSETVNLPQGNAYLPSELSLVPTPNPFNPRTVLRFDLPTAGNTNLKIYDIAGRLVATLYDCYLMAGEHQARFDGTALSSGLYVAVLNAGNQQISTRLMLLK